MKCQILFSWKNKKHRIHFVIFVIIFPENRFYILSNFNLKVSGLSSRIIIKKYLVMGDWSQSS